MTIEQRARQLLEEALSAWDRNSREKRDVEFGTEAWCDLQRNEERISDRLTLLRELLRDHQISFEDVHEAVKRAAGWTDTLHSAAMIDKFARQVAGYLEVPRPARVPIAEALAAPVEIGQCASADYPARKIPMPDRPEHHER